MPTAIQRRRGSTAAHSAFTGLSGEITVDTDKQVPVVHDGVTPGGHPVQPERIKDKNAATKYRVVVVDGMLMTEEV